MKRFLQIYWPFASNEIKREFAYKGKFYLYIVGNLFSAFISYYLWKAIYSNSNNNTLGGFTQNEMITYVFISFIVANVVSISISEEISQNVIDGSIAINLIKPIEYRWRLIAKAIGCMLYRFIIPSSFVWIGVEVFRVFVLNYHVTSVFNMIIFLISCLMSFFIYVLFDFCFGMIAFYTTYIFGLEIIKGAILTFLSGQLIPLSFFPENIQKIFGYLPFSSMNYAPVMIYLGKYSNHEIAMILLKQIFWVVVFYVLGSLIWKKVTKRLIVLGG